MTDERHPGDRPSGEVGHDDAALQELLRQRAASIDPTPSRHDLARRVADDDRQRRRRLRIVAGVAAALVLLVGAGVAAAVAGRDEPDRNVTTGPGPDRSTTSTSIVTMTTTLASTTSPATSATAAPSTTVPATTTAPPATTTVAPTTDPPLSLVPPERWTVAPGTLGPLTFPVDVTTASRLSGLDLRTAVDFEPWVDQCGYVEGLDDVPWLTMEHDASGAIVMARIDGYAIRSPDGIGIGSTEADVLAAYAGRIGRTPLSHNVGDPPTWNLMRVTDRSRPGVAMVFRSTNGVVDQIRVGKDGWLEGVEGCTG